MAALDEEMVIAYQEAEKVLGDQLADVITPRTEGKSEEAWYRENIDALNRAMEDGRAYLENSATRQVDAREEEGSSGFAGAYCDGEISQKGNRPDEGGADGRAGFRLERQSEAELRANADEEAA